MPVKVPLHDPTIYDTFSHEFPALDCRLTCLTSDLLRFPIEPPAPGVSKLGLSRFEDLTLMTGRDAPCSG